MVDEQLPSLEIYILQKGARDEAGAREQSITIRSRLAQLATDFDLHVGDPMKTIDGFRAPVWGKTSKKTYDKIFNAETKYDIDPDYSTTQKIWIPVKPAQVPEGLKDLVKEVGLDYW